MRFKATHENLTIHVPPEEMAECLREIVRHLVPRHTHKVYVFSEATPPFPVKENGVTLVSAIDQPSNFLQNFRIILRPGELVIVSGQAGFTRDKWRDLAESVRASERGTRR